MSLQAHGLAGGRGFRPLFSGLSLSVAAGESLWVSGPNGSGKTTLLRLLCGLSEPLQGEVRWHDRPLRQALRDGLGHTLLYIGHAPALKDELTALENLRVASVLGGQPCTDAQALDALAVLGLRDRAHLPARALSQGQRRRVGLARLALPRAAGLLVLDEPFTALDTDAVARVTALIDQRLQRGDALVYTTHQPATFQASTQHTLVLGATALREAA